MSTLFEETLPTRTKTLIGQLQAQQPAFLQSFYLSGGTGLALQIGHRESEDLDFFSQSSFDPLLIEQQLLTLGQLQETEPAAGTLNTFLNGVKLQFLEYPYQLLQPLDEWQGILLSSVIDIACTKLQTISMRGSKKDFIDLYFLLDLYSLPELLKLTEKKYRDVDYNQAHIIKSLVYFDDAQQQPMPRMLKQVEWDDVREKIVHEVKNLTF